MTDDNACSCSGRAPRDLEMPIKPGGQHQHTLSKVMCDAPADTVLLILSHTGD